MTRKLAILAAVAVAAWRARPAVRTLVEAVREGTGSKYRTRSGRGDRR